MHKDPLSNSIAPIIFRSLIIINFILILAHLIFRMQLPLFLDETNTYYLSNLGISELIKKVFLVQHHSPLHFILNKISYNLFAPFLPMEVALRFLSLIIIFANTYLLFIIARKYFSKQIGYLIVLFFLSAESYLRIAVQARPYSLGFLLVTLSFYLITNFKGTKKDWISLTLINILILYSHYFASQVFISQTILFYLLNKERLKSYLISLGLSLSSLILCTPQIINMLHKGQDLVIATIPNLKGIWHSLFYPEIIPILIIYLFVQTGVISKITNNKSNQFVLLGLIILITSQAYILFISLFTEGSFYLERYLIFSFLGIVLIFIGLVAQIKNLSLLILILSIFAVQNIVLIYKTTINQKDHVEPWKDISTYISTQSQKYSNCTLINIPIYIESSNINLITDKEFQNYFASNFIAYPIQNDIINFPRTYTHSDVEELDDIVNQLSSSKCIILLAPPPLWDRMVKSGKVGSTDYLREKFQSLNFKMHDKKVIRKFSISLYNKS